MKQSKLQSKKVKQYENEFLKLVDELNISETKKLRLETLFFNFGYMKKLKLKEHINLVNN